MNSRGGILLPVIAICVIILGILVGVKPIRQKIFKLINKPATQVAPYQTPGGNKNIPAPASRKSDQYGVITGILVPEEPFFNDAMGYAGALGIGWIRFDNQWSDTEPKDNQWDFSSTDKYVNTALAQGLKVLLVSDPDLDSSFCSAPGTRIKAVFNLKPPFFHSKLPRCSDEQLKDYITHIVTRYKGKVTHYEIGNELDLRKTWTDYPEEYARVLALAYPTIKSIDPNAVVLIGGLASGGGQDSASGYLQKLIAAGALNNFDIMNYHTYDKKENITTTFSQVKSMVGDKPIWITEVGYPSSPKDPEKYKALSPYPEGEEGQAAYLQDILPHILSLGVEKVFWADLIDVPRGNDQFCTHGLVYILGKQCLDVGEEEGRKVNGELKTKKTYDVYKLLTGQ